ncbi:MAG: hypothetical protein QOJ06_1197 [Pseudonocardiales bacterium]|jgi:hypothetical protein|nr:hypothetical protein [Pseudonocardiales bacterium]
MDLSGIPCAELRFDKDGIVVSPDEHSAVLALAARPEITDLIVLSHGWNNDMDEARALYRALAAQLAGPGSVGLGIVGVLWPSKRFDDAELIPGGAAALAAGPSIAELHAELAAFGVLLDDEAAAEGLAAAASALPAIDTAASARRAFVDGVRSALHASTGLTAGNEEAPAAMVTADGAELLDRLARPATLIHPAHPSFGGGGATSLGTPHRPTGGAAGLDIFGGIRNAARNLLNFTTYYTMKERAGTIGFHGLAPVLTAVHAQRTELRLHLVGHSFGGRLVSAAATGGAGDPALPLSSMVLLQAAFSHFGFAENWDPGKDGLFRGCLSGHRVDGPTIATHTANDRAVGIAYALASRIAGQIAAAVGDASDVYGGIGRNGALRTPEAVAGELLDFDRAYSFRPGAVHNLLADHFIHSHSDITGPQVGHLLRSVVSTGVAVS